jgi:acyl-lipid omega-6 desaturase (Delta-12 desaturase)
MRSDRVRLASEYSRLAPEFARHLLGSMPRSAPRAVIRLSGGLAIDYNPVREFATAPYLMNGTAKTETWFAPERQARLMRRETTRPLLLLCRDFLLYFVSLGGAIAPLPLPVSLAASVWAGIMIGGIFVAGHDACHQALTPHRKLNDWIGRIALAPGWTTRSLWKHFHNRNHHSYTNVIGVDYAWSPMSLATWRRTGRARQAVYRLYRSPVGFLPYYLIEMWWKCHFLPWATPVRARWRDHVADAGFALTWQVATIGCILAGGGVLNPQASVPYLIGLGWLLPFLVWNTLIGVVIYAHHTHPAVAWYSNTTEAKSSLVQVTGVVHAVLPQPPRFLSSNIMEHNAHHAIPTLPHYHLAEAQREMELSFPSIARMVVHSRQMLTAIRTCKLYDTQRHCWADYAGHRTGPLHARPD